METLSDDTLRDAREKVLSRGALLRDRLQRVQADLRRAREVRESDEVLLAIEISASAELARIEAALDHMEDDTFGLCEECGREIEAARFVATPYATHCKSCAPDA